MTTRQSGIFLHAVSVCFIALFARACVTDVAAQSRQNRRAVVSFAGGLNLRDSPVVLGRLDGEGPRPYAVGNSYNYEYHADGRVTLRPGSRMDGVGVRVYHNYAPVEYLFYSPNREASYNGIAYGIADSLVLYRYLPSGVNAWARLFNAPPQALKFRRGGIYSSVFYNNRHLIGGDAADCFEAYYRLGVGPVARRALLPPDLRSPPTASVGTGGSLTASTTYSYVYTFVAPHASAGGLEEESYASVPATATTTDTTKTITLANVRGYPSYTYSGDIDTLHTVETRNVYRSEAGGPFYYLTTLDNPATRTFVDDGTLTPDITLLAPETVNLPTSYRFLAEYAGFLWGTGTGSTRVARWQTSSALTTSASDTLLSVTPYANSALSVVSDTLAGPWQVSYYPASGSVSARVTKSGKSFTTSGIRAGDYFVTRSAASQVLRVLSDTTLLVEYPGSDYGGDTNFTASIGNNLYTIGGSTEVIGLVYRTGGKWRVKRGAFSTLRKATTAFAAAYAYVPGRATDLLYVSEQYNPQRCIPTQDGGTSFGSYDNPIDVTPGQYGDITGLLGGDNLTIYKENAIFSMTGTGVGDFTLRKLTDGIGNIAPGALVQNRGRNFFLDASGLFAHNQSSIDKLSDILSTAILDSAAVETVSPFTGAKYRFIDHAAATVYDNRFLLSVVGDTSDAFSANVWCLDLTSGLWTRYTGWSPKTWTSWPTDTTTTRVTAWGDWRTFVETDGDYKALIKHIDPTSTTDATLTHTGAGDSATAITRQVVTPRYNFGDRDAWFEEFLLVADTADSMRVTFSIGQYDTTYTFTTAISGGVSTGTPGVPAVRIIPIRAQGNSCQITIWQTGTNGGTLYPSTLVFTDPKEQ